jgi:penicillin-binding protein 1A
MSSSDPFDLPEGYGGIARDGGTGGNARGNDGAVPAQPPATDGPAQHPRARDVIDRFNALIGGHASSRATAPAPPVDAAATPPLTTTLPAPSKWRRRWPWIKRGLQATLLLFIVMVGWLAWTAPLSRSLEPIAPPPMTLVSADGQAFARNGAIIDDPVDVKRLPPHVVEAFLATEDRRFYSHWGVDPWGLGRAFWNNLTTGSRQGGSTITQQLAKFTFLDSDQTYTRKARELLIAFWLEARLTKDEILSRYLSNAFFGDDNVYGLRAASLHYFYRQPERLTLSQATMLAGMLRAPNRYTPTEHLRAAQQRQRVVIRAMVAAGYLTEAEAARVRLATVDHRPQRSLPSGTYFADWANDEARASIPRGYAEQRVITTLNARLQRIANRVTANAGLNGAQVALVAMRPDGEVVAMVGGRSYAASQFNRATSARLQPGSTFKLAVYLAALRSGMTPDTPVDDSPITEGPYRPTNYGGTYRGETTLREAFARSSNVVAVRLYTQLGGAAVRRAARDLGIRSAIADNASAALGTSEVSLIELTAAYAMIAGNYGPVEPHALVRPEPGFVESLFDGQSSLGSGERAAMLDLLSSAITNGTGRAARLGIPAYGKTGTTQDSRSALFVGFAGDLVVGVWVGRDDNRPVRGLTGGGLPARIWRDFMVAAIPNAAPRRAPAPTRNTDDALIPDLPIAIERPEVRINPETGISVETTVGGVGVSIDSNGVDIKPPPKPGE